MDAKKVALLIANVWKQKLSALHFVFVVDVIPLETKSAKQMLVNVAHIYQTPSGNKLEILILK